MLETFPTSAGKSYTGSNVVGRLPKIGLSARAMECIDLVSNLI